MIGLIGWIIGGGIVGWLASMITGRNPQQQKPGQKNP